MNSYYLITLPNAQSQGRLTAFQAFGVDSQKARERLHTKLSLDGTKVIVQGEIRAELQAHIVGKAFIEYLGDCLENGQAEQSVYDYLSESSAEWYE